MDKFKKPEFKIDEYSVEQNHGKFIVEPLERGFGTTLGNALRRVLLSSLPGTAMYAVEIEGIRHEFSAIAGVEEDATSLILNLKAVNYVSESYAMNQESEIKLKVIGPKVVTANDFITPSGIDVINKDAYICTVAEGGSLDATIYVKTGRGYVLAEKNKSNKLPFGTIPTDSNFTPIKKVAFEVEPTRVGHDSNYDRLIMDVTTNGACTPQEAIALSAKIIIEHLELFAKLETLSIFDEKVIDDSQVEEHDKYQDMSIEELDLSVRSYNCLKRANILTVQELTQKTEEDMMKVRNLGKKSLKEVREKLKACGLSFKISD
ncbi:MAG TPA: DNA-directed RNA polymerase subunit alpha [Candidatus Caccosoma faecigallinarum]|uniref:DNA-directed RNA polymerase subunit alpha n=1 Tax=Candidatus Caccosoma faecigallinarum TaxID=2840720 RepID=A0A9D1G753_9FIRM|nr:dNA-directed RNA polymerase subunit alpha [Firmicutes bacterium CAG:631]HIT16936.1 DNA-directed RNA polymerase subunit alpha [Candidatus Caccosoma faecigallinarum]